MRLRIQHPLFAGFLGITGLLVLLIVVFVGSGLRREMRSSFVAELERLLALGERVLAASDGQDAHELVRTIAERTGYRVALIGSSGRVIADSALEPEQLLLLENHADRPEVRRVLRGEDRTAFGLPEKNSVGDALLYGARRVTFVGAPAALTIAAPQTEIEASVQRIQRRVAVTGVLALVVALLAAYALSVALARPLVNLADRARRLAEGDFSGSVPRARIMELQELAAAFNRLTDQLRDRLADLRSERDEMEALIDCMAEGVIALSEEGRLVRANRAARVLLGVADLPPQVHVGSLVRHPELREALKESVARPEQSREIAVGGRHLLLASRALDHGGAVATLLDITDLRRMERVRSDFVANASHELKTPLTSIRGYAEALADEPPEHMRLQFLRSILSNTLRLQRLVDDLLDLSRLESGGWKANLEPVVVGEVVEEAWELVGPRADHEVAFTLRGAAVVIGDRQGLVQIFRNLFDNAVRHTPAGGHVEVSVGPDPDSEHVLVSVRDDGEGIPAQALPRIFERFYRADSSRARGAGGTGLGLSIVKHLVSAMNGEVWAESELGRGTTIWIRRPRPDAPV
jgi:two-component system phosphate regulon sensor histidine kinase PhoR